MPTYTFIDKITQEVFDVVMTMKDYDFYKEENPHHERYIDQAPQLISGTGLKTDSGFKEVLSKISEAHPDSHLANEHSRKSIKQIKTERVVKEWKKKTSSIG